MTLKIGGKKFSGKHTSYIDAAEEPVKFLVGHSKVKKVSLGIIRSCKSGTGARSIKSKETDSGLEVTIRGSSYAQTIWVYLFENDQVVKEAISQQLKQVFDGR